MHVCGDPACAYMRGLHNGEGEEGCCKCGRVGTNTERIQEKRNGGRVWDLERYKPERGASCIVRMWVGIMRCAIEDGELVSFREMTHARRRAWGHRACTHGDPACVPGPRMHGGDSVRVCMCVGIRYGHWDPAVTAEGQCCVRRHTMKRLSVRKK